MAELAGANSAAPRQETNQWRGRCAHLRLLEALDDVFYPIGVELLVLHQELEHAVKIRRLPDKLPLITWCGRSSSGRREDARGGGGANGRRGGGAKGAEGQKGRRGGATDPLS